MALMLRVNGIILFVVYSIKTNAVNNRSEINEFRRKLRDHFGDLATRYHLTSLALFGSRVRGEQRPDSDLDVLAHFATTPSLFQLLALEIELSDLLGVRVDLAPSDSLRPAVAQTVLSEQVPV
jgi:uncharacterized protein